MNQSIKRKSIRGIMFILLIILVGAKSYIAKAQSVHNYTYYGYGLSLSVPQQTLSSNISQLNGLKVNLVGYNLGGMIANKYGKLKANIGSYYSGSSTPYEIDVLRGSISGHIYMLRLSKVKAHLFEPYAVLGMSQQVSKFYGNYLSNDPQNVSSSTSQPLLGKVNSTRMNVGAGVELQLENDFQKFIHVFAEVTYGAPLSSSASNSSFSQTKVMNAITFNLGVNFGIVKISR
ncbi:MAG: hypothetical protein HY015_09640 [Bacteroidetes bacterium]|nr:hypothetical protein [Bacteroidota bacterium]